jgi:hypothetical protein
LYHANKGECRLAATDESKMKGKSDVERGAAINNWLGQWAQIIGVVPDFLSGAARRCHPQGVGCRSRGCHQAVAVGIHPLTVFAHKLFVASQKPVTLRQE